MAWWLSRGGQPEGPYQDAQLYQLIQSGQLRGAHICEEGGSVWKPIEQHPVFGAAMVGRAGAMPPGAEPYAFSGAPMAQHGPNAPGQPSMAHAAPARPKRGAPVAMIIVGVAAALVLVGGGLFFAQRTSTSTSDDSGLDPKEAKRRAAVFEKSLATIKKLDAAAEPPVDTDGYDDPRIYVPFDAPGQYVNPSENRSVLVVHVEDLKEPELYRDNLVPRITGSGAAGGCAASLISYKKKKDERVPEGFLWGCTKLEYLAVLRVREHVEPKVVSTSDNEATNTRTHLFAAGKITGYVVVFELEHGKRVGGFSFAAVSSEKPERTFDGEDLQKDLMKQLHEALEAGDRRAREKARGASPAP